MPEPQSISRSIQLLVEGNDQRNFFSALCDHISITDVQIQNFGGVPELRGFLLALSNASAFSSVSSVGIVRDAELNAADALRSVQGSLRNAGLPVPDRPGERVGEHPTASVLILPGGNRRGMLETLLCETFADDRENDCIEAFFECVESLPGLSVDRPDKARAHAWLATRPDPHVSVGFAAQKGYWDLEHSALDSVREFLTAL